MLDYLVKMNNCHFNNLTNFSFSTNPELPSSHLRYVRWKSECERYNVSYVGNMEDNNDIEDNMDYLNH